VLRELEAGAKTEQVCRRHGISSATFYKWKAKYGGLDVSEARRLKSLEDENRRLKKLLAESMLDKRGAEGPARKKRLKPVARKAAVARLVEQRGLSQVRACRLVGLNRSSMNYRPRRPDDSLLRQRLRELAAERRRFGYRRLGWLLEREGHVMNRKKLYRLYREEKLMVRRRRGRKRALGTRAPMMLPGAINQRWSLDFVVDALSDGRRLRILCVVDDFSRECLATLVDTSLGGVRVVRELDRLTAKRALPRMVLATTGPSSPAAQCCVGPPGDWSGTTSNPASRCRTLSSNRSTAGCGTSASTSTFSSPWPRRARPSKRGVTTTITCDHTTASAH